MNKSQCGEGLFYLQWHITERCHNNCSHCYSKGRRMKEETTMSNFHLIFQDLYNMCKSWKRGLQVTLIGGDPLLHPDFKRFVDYINQHQNVRIMVAGNPETLTTEMIEWLKPRIFAFQLSVDGMQDNHDYFRYKGSYKIVMDKIRQATKMGLRIHVMTTVSQKNLCDLIPVMHTVYEAGCHRWAFARYVPPVGQILDIDNNEYYNTLLELDEQHQQYLKKGHDEQRKDPLWSLVRNIEPEYNPDMCQIDGCGIGSPTLGILPDNTVMACRRHAGSTLGKWQKDGDFYYFMIDSPVMEKLRNLESIKKCGNCKLLYNCRGCRAIGYAVDGKLDTPDPTCWLN